MKKIAFAMVASVAVANGFNIGLNTPGRVGTRYAGLALRSMTKFPRSVSVSSKGFAGASMKVKMCIAESISVTQRLS